MCALKRPQSPQDQKSLIEQGLAWPHMDRVWSPAVRADVGWPFLLLPRHVLREAADVMLLFISDASPSLCAGLLGSIPVDFLLDGHPPKLLLVALGSPKQSAAFLAPCHTLPHISSPCGSTQGGRIETD